MSDGWGIDCINMASFANSNGGVHGYKFILTVVDYISSYVWARKMKTQTALNVTKALESIVQETNTYPKIIQADNGTEFMNVGLDEREQRSLHQNIIIYTNLKWPCKT